MKKFQSNGNMRQSKHSPTLDGLIETRVSGNSLQIYSKETSE